MTAFHTYCPLFFCRRLDKISIVSISRNFTRSMEFGELSSLSCALLTSVIFNINKMFTFPKKRYETLNAVQFVSVTVVVRFVCETRISFEHAHRVLGIGGRGQPCLGLIQRLGGQRVLRVLCHMKGSSDIHRIVASHHSLYGIKVHTLLILGQSVSHSDRAG